jgi:hypothetical protein
VLQGAVCCQLGKGFNNVGCKGWNAGFRYQRVVAVLEFQLVDFSTSRLNCPVAMSVVWLSLAMTMALLQMSPIAMVTGAFDFCFRSGKH